MLFYLFLYTIVKSKLEDVLELNYRQTSNSSHTLVGNKIVDHSDEVGASPLGAAPTTSSFSTQRLASIDCTKATARDEKHLILVIWCAYIRDLTVDVFFWGGGYTRELKTLKKKHDEEYKEWCESHLIPPCSGIHHIAVWWLLSILTLVLVNSGALRVNCYHVHATC